MSLAPGRRKDPGLCLTDSQEAKSLVATMSCHACPCRVIASRSTSSFYQQLVSLAWAGSQGSLSLHPHGPWHCLSFILLFSSLSSSTYPCIPVSLSLSLSFSGSFVRFHSPFLHNGKKKMMSSLLVLHI